MTQSDPPASAPAGWYPVAGGGRRFWDGSEWTSVVVGAPDRAAAEHQPGGATPVAVTAGFWLWWPLIVAQSLLIALCAYRFVEAAVVIATIPLSGPSAGWTFIILGPIALVTVALQAVEISQVVRLHRGRADARVALVVLAILNVAVVSGLFLLMQPARLWESEFIFSQLLAGLFTALAIGAAIAIIASLLPFHRSTKDFFARASATTSRYEGPPPAPASGAEGRP